MDGDVRKESPESVPQVQEELDILEDFSPCQSSSANTESPKYYIYMPGSGLCNELNPDGLTMDEVPMDALPLDGILAYKSDVLQDVNLNASTGRVEDESMLNSDGQEEAMALDLIMHPARNSSANLSKSSSVHVNKCLPLKGDCICAGCLHTGQQELSERPMDSRVVDWDNSLLTSATYCSHVYISPVEQSIASCQNADHIDCLTVATSLVLPDEAHSTDSPEPEMPRVAENQSDQVMEVSPVSCDTVTDRYDSSHLDVIPVGTGQEIHTIDLQASIKNLCRLCGLLIPDTAPPTDKFRMAADIHRALGIDVKNDAKQYPHNICHICKLKLCRWRRQQINSIPGCSTSYSAVNIQPYNWSQIFGYLINPDTLIAVSKNNNNMTEVKNTMLEIHGQSPDDHIQAPVDDVTCFLCHKLFQNPHHLSKHICEHTKQHKCDSCQKAYKSKKSLNRHWRKCHGTLD